MLIAGEDEDFEVDLDTKDDGDPSSQLAPSTNSQLTLMELSVFALGGITGLHMMKLCGHIADIGVMVMVDSGVSHCFNGRQIGVACHFYRQVWGSIW